MPSVKISRTKGQKLASDTSVNGPQAPTSALEAPTPRARTPRRTGTARRGDRMSRMAVSSEPRESLSVQKRDPEAHAVAAGAGRRAGRRHREGSERSRVGRLPE